MHTPRKLPWTLIATWLLVSAVAMAASCLTYPAATLNGEYVPVGNDAFYHARRILDTVRDPSSFYEFDAHIHAPEGSLLTWPWGFDYALAHITRGAMALGLSDDPMAILVWIPVLAFAINIGLLFAITRQLPLSPAFTVLAGLAMAVAPTNQLLHGVGEFDHHFAELSFILAALAAGLAWLRKPESQLRAALAAVVLGLAPAVQNGLFIIQLPLLATLFVLWLQNRTVPARSGLTFALTLLLSTLAIVLPSEPARLGRFEFYTLSWFHLYIAACSAVTVTLLSRLQATRNGILMFALISVALLIPIVTELPIAQEFITGTPTPLKLITEMEPPLRAGLRNGMAYIADYYSSLIFLVPLTMLLCAYKGFRERSSPRLLFWVTSLMGLALLVSQMRMHYFGGFALLLPWLIVLQEFCDRAPQHFKKTVLLTALALVLLYYPPLRHQLVAPMSVANDLSFRETRPMLATIAKACAEDPGVILADSNIGHYIRFYSDCSVVANNFLLTKQHFDKIDQMQHLFTLTPEQLMKEAPWVKYVLIRPGDIMEQADGQLTFSFIGPTPYLAKLMYEEHSPAAQHSPVPDGLELVGQVRLPGLYNVPYATLYKVHAKQPPAVSSANDVGE
ncbi:hypothetical protein [Peristeroidobacter agariperforans]|uniref:hypothetical protein n=1 Tax=Peristeroidobacter agariperforans TaxID=268404 RepID=UPI00101DCF23|nr:hypothetical protein [Peristeroidobacter agariperforans]